MSSPTDADMRLVSWEAWRGLLGVMTAGLVRRENLKAANAAGFITEARGGELVSDLRTPKGTHYLARLRELAALKWCPTCNCGARVNPAGCPDIFHGSRGDGQLEPLDRAVRYVREQDGE